MGIGSSLLLIAAGAILRWAVSVNTHGINLQTVGLILLIVGAAGLVISLLWIARAGDDARRAVPRTDLPPDPRY